MVAMLASAPAWADPAERCAAGVYAEQHGELTHAAMLLDACDTDALSPQIAQVVARAKRELKQKLDAGDYAVVEVISKPEGLDATVDALPSEHFTTPVKLYVSPGKHAFTVGAQTITIDAKPHTRAPIYVEQKAAPVTSPKDGKVDFNEGGGEPEAEQQVAPPPDQKHPPLTPCKYSNSCTEAGEAIADPLAEQQTAPPRFPRIALELRGGAAYASSLEPSLALVVAKRAWWNDRDDTHPFVLQWRGAWSRRPDANAYILTGSLLKVLAATDTAWLSGGAGGTFDSYTGVAASVIVQLALRRLPVTLAGQYDQGLEHSMGSLPHVFTLELGVGWRGY